MLRSKTITPGLFLFGGAAVVWLVAAVVFAVGSSAVNSDQGLIDTLVAPFTLGWKGGVGSHLGYTVLLGSAVAAGVLGGVLQAFRDSDAEAEAQVAHLEAAPLTAAPRGASYAPLTVGLAGVALIIGLAAEPLLAWAAGFVLLAAAIVWTVRAWALRATADDTANHELYERVMEPWRVPALSVVVIAFVILGVSRLLLAVSQLGSVVVFSLIATAFFLGAIFVASRPRMSRAALTSLVALAAVIVLVAAIIGLVAGEREFKDYSKVESGAPAAAGTLAPPGVSGGNTGVRS